MGKMDLSTRNGRIQNMRWLINLSSMLPGLVSHMPEKAVEFNPMQGYFLCLTTEYSLMLSMQM
jgi:hypothetical protein